MPAFLLVIAFFKLKSRSCFLQHTPAINYDQKLSSLFYGHSGNKVA
jgi:hypothetical protein